MVARVRDIVRYEDLATPKQAGICTRPTAILITFLISSMILHLGEYGASGARRGNQSRLPAAATPTS
jgi:hypothetical protein